MFLLQIHKFTTPMYRSPEQLETWNNYPIGPKVDIWALGCILYCLCFNKHPYEDAATLRIINANYALPSDTKYNCYHDIIKGCFQVDPRKRFDSNILLEKLESIAETKGWSLNDPLGITSNALFSPEPTIPSSPLQQLVNTSLITSKSAPPRPSTVPQMPAQPPLRIETQRPTSLNQAQGGLFSSIKGGAGSFIKNLKDTSSKVMQTVQQTMIRNELDISIITQRILVMPCPTEGIESAYKTNHIDDVKIYLETRYMPSKLSIYNLGGRSCPRLPPPVRTVEASSIYLPSLPKAPALMGMYALAEDMYGFLSINHKNVIVLQSSDGGKAAAATMLCALFIYSGLVIEPEDGMQIFAVKRFPPMMRASELRYLYYLGDICRSTPHLPHFFPVTLVSLTISPIPRMTKARDGCRIFVEVSCNDRAILSTLQEYERLRVYNVVDGKIVLQLNVQVQGDVTITLNHARRSLGGISRPQAHRICQFQINTGYIPEEETLISLGIQDLDDLPDDDHIPNNFHVGLSVFVSDSEQPPTKSPPWTVTTGPRDPKVLFGSQLEYEENVDNFITKPPKLVLPCSTSSRNVLPPRPPPPTSIGPDIVRRKSEDTENLIDEDDLLNIQLEEKKLATKSSAKECREPSFDLLKGFDSDIKQCGGTIPDLLGSSDDIFEPTIHQSASSSDLTGINFGAFTQISTSNNRNQLNTASQPVFSTPAQQQSQANGRTKTQTTKTDPFADLGNLSAQLPSGWTQTPLITAKTSASSTPSPRSTQFSSPTHQLHGTVFSSDSTSKNSSPIHQQPTRPDYSRSHFEPPNSGQNQKLKTTTDVFGDILGQQGYSFGSGGNKGPKSINEMRKEELAKDMDPERLKVMEWTEGKKNNIRALLCSVHTILWSGAKWQKCEMSQLVGASDVKKAYRRACLAVHPDKVS